MKYGSLAPFGTMKLYNLSHFVCVQPREFGVGLELLKLFDRYTVVEGKSEIDGCPNSGMGVVLGLQSYAVGDLETSKTGEAGSDIQDEPVLRCD